MAAQLSPGIPSRRPQPDQLLDLVNAVLPSKAIALIIGFLLLYPLLVLTAKLFFAPLYSILLGLFTPFTPRLNLIEPPVVFFAKTIAFSVLALTSICFFVGRLQVLYHQHWIRLIPQAHPKLSPFSPHRRLSLMAFFNWTIYRWMRLLKQPLLLGSLFFASVILLITMIQWLPPVIPVVSDLFLILGLFLVLATGYGSIFMALELIKTISRTALGQVIVLLQPEASSAEAYQLSAKLGPQSPWYVVMLILGATCIMVTAIGLALLLYGHSLTSYLTNPLSWLGGLIISLITLLLWITYSAVKFFVYCDSLYRLVEEQANQPKPLVWPGKQQ